MKYLIVLLMLSGCTSSLKKDHCYAMYSRESNTVFVKILAINKSDWYYIETIKSNESFISLVKVTDTTMFDEIYCDTFKKLEEFENKLKEERK